jgi:hypothetical protein
MTSGVDVCFERGGRVYRRESECRICVPRAAHALATSARELAFSATPLEPEKTNASPNVHYGERRKEDENGEGLELNPFSPRRAFGDQWASLCACAGEEQLGNICSVHRKPCADAAGVLCETWLFP